ncbi:hypothetical protein ACFWRZ_07910 [Streptomyces rubiginosohelvolus]|uniref:hypothetical protein n=1 Tax=Streptomyces rubiginosohelvolus TaxID=67362 RepID=UPI00365891BB
MTEEQADLIEGTPARQPAYDAVYQIISSLPPGDASRNATIWRAVTAALDAMDQQARSRLDRVREIADQLAVHGRLGVDLEADGIRRGVAQQLHDALGVSPKASEAPA